MGHGGLRAGAGRKIGSKTKRSVVKRSKRFNIWLDADLRELLEASARAKGRRLSEEIRDLLRDGANGRSEMLDWCGNDTNLGLVQLVARMISEVERITQRSWRTDAFSFEFLISGLQQIFRELRSHIPANAPGLPKSVEQGPDDTRDPTPVAQTLGVVIANSVWTQMRLIQSPAIKDPGRYHDDFWTLPKVRIRLNIDPISPNKR
jgi:hypothetical protein